MRFMGFSNYTEVWEITMKRNTLLQLDEFITGVQTAGKCLVRTLKATRLRYVDHEERNPTPWASWQRVTSSAREPHNGLSQVQCWVKNPVANKQTNKAHTKDSIDTKNQHIWWWWKSEEVTFEILTGKGIRDNLGDQECSLYDLGDGD